MIPAGGALYSRSDEIAEANARTIKNILTRPLASLASPSAAQVYAMKSLLSRVWSTLGSNKATTFLFVVHEQGIAEIEGLSASSRGGQAHTWTVTSKAQFRGTGPVGASRSHRYYCVSSFSQWVSQQRGWDFALRLFCLGLRYRSTFFYFLWRRSQEQSG